MYFSRKVAKRGTTQRYFTIVLYTIIVYLLARIHCNTKLTPNQGHRFKVINTGANSKNRIITVSKIHQEPRIGTKSLKEPEQCNEWRRVGWKPSILKLYHGHNSHDFTDWFLYTTIFNESWHLNSQRRPLYIDIAATHARRWSSTWSLDRSLGWEGICAELNQIKGVERT